MNEIGSYQENVQHLQSLGCDTSNLKVSGGVLHNFTEGWALKMFGPPSVHYFKKNNYGHYPTKCGIPAPKPSNPNGDFFAPGSYSVCKHCLRYAKLHRIAPPPVQNPVIESNARNVV